MGCIWSSKTDALVTKMGTAAYISYETNTTTTTGEYAARLSDIHEAGGYSDWFLPSKDELELMYQHLKKNNVGGFADSYYWSSSESGAYNAWDQHFSNVLQYGEERYSEDRVRPVRAF